VAGLWRLAVAVPAHLTEAFEAALRPFAEAVVLSECADGRWQVQALCPARPEPAVAEIAVAVAAAAAGIAAPEITSTPVISRDWVAESQRNLPPLTLGRFFVYGAHVRTPVPPGTIPLAMEAGMAFGSGHHASTAGCLIALSALSRDRRRRLLDLGCGSGILAIAAAKLLHAPVIAADIDPAAVAETRTNARRNRVGGLIRAVRANGLAAATIRQARPFDLICANILARPLKRLAGAVAAALAPGGVVVLSGFITRDAAAVGAAYQAFGLRLIRADNHDGWITLVLKRSDGLAVGGVRYPAA
jgi:ribosomal protein L11 methyltransferase